MQKPSASDAIPVTSQPVEPGQGKMVTIENPFVLSPATLASDNP